MMEPELRDADPARSSRPRRPIRPSDPGDYEYPFPDAANQRLYARYRERADAVAGLVVCGRLGEYRYYDMDQAIGRALDLGAALSAGASSGRRGDSAARRNRIAMPRTKLSRAACGSRLR